MFKLYDYQTKLINQIRENFKQKSICVVSPCGSGKSVIQASIAKSATDKGNRVLFMVHRKELCDQITKTFKSFGVDLKLCKIAMVQTISRRLDKEPEPKIVMTDENHHCLANSYLKVYEKFENALLLGFTATPIRLNGVGLGKIYNHLIEGPKVKWLIKNDFLSPYRLFSVKLATTDDLHIRLGEYKSNEVKELMEDSKIYGDTIEHYKKLADGKKTIIYCATIDSSIETVKRFNENGISAIHLDSKKNKIERNKAVKDFKENKIQVLSNVDLFGEGFDVPDCECVILLRPTKSLSLYIQQSMRCMRYKEGKQAIIIDHVGNCFTHGLPDDDFEWSLEGKKKEQKSKQILKECPSCFMVFPKELKACPFCGYKVVKTIVQNKLEEDKSAILEEITSKDILKRKKHDYYLKIKTLKELINFWEIKKYKKGWLIYKIEERKNFLKITCEDLQHIQKLFDYRKGWWIHKAKEFNIYEEYKQEKIS